MSLSIKHACFKRYHHDLLRPLVAFSKVEWFISSDHKIKNFSTNFIVAFQYGLEVTKSTLFMGYSARYVELAYQRYGELGSHNVANSYSGGAMVYWIEPLALDQRVVGSTPVNARLFCPSARHFIHIAAFYPGV